jgi:hypothetical protein
MSVVPEEIPEFLASSRNEMASVISATTVKSMLILITRSYRMSLVGCGSFTVVPLLIPIKFMGGTRTISIFTSAVFEKMATSLGGKWWGESKVVSVTTDITEKNIPPLSLKHLPTLK